MVSQDPTVERFECEGLIGEPGGAMEQDDGGQWVSYEDYGELWDSFLAVQCLVHRLEERVDKWRERAEGKRP